MVCVVAPAGNGPHTRVGVVAPADNGHHSRVGVLGLAGNGLHTRAGVMAILDFGPLPAGATTHPSVRTQHLLLSLIFHL